MSEFYHGVLCGFMLALGLWLAWRMSRELWFGMEMDYLTRRVRAES